MMMELALDVLNAVLMVLDFVGGRDATLARLDGRRRRGNSVTDRHVGGLLEGGKRETRVRRGVRVAMKE